MGRLLTKEHMKLIDFLYALSGNVESAHGHKRCGVGGAKMIKTLSKIYQFSGKMQGTMKKLSFFLSCTPFLI